MYYMNKTALPCLAFKLAGKRQTVNSYTFLNHVFTHFQFLNCCFADWKKMCSVHSIFFHQVVTRNKIIVFFFCVPNAYFFSRNEFEKCLETMSSFGTLSFFFFLFLEHTLQHSVSVKHKYAQRGNSSSVGVQNKRWWVIFLWATPVLSCLKSFSRAQSLVVCVHRLTLQYKTFLKSELLKMFLRNVTGICMSSDIDLNQLK